MDYPGQGTRAEVDHLLILLVLSLCVCVCVGMYHRRIELVKDTEVLIQMCL